MVVGSLAGFNSQPPLWCSQRVRGVGSTFQVGKGEGREFTVSRRRKSSLSVTAR